MNEPEKDNEAVELQRDSEPWPSPGRILKELRESRGMTQGQVGEALHLTLHYINALENDLYQKLPGKTFAKGYLKSYGALLGADVDEIVARFEKLCESRDESARATETPVLQQRRAGDQHKRWMIAAGFLLLAILGVAWWSGNDNAAGNQLRGVAAQPRSEAPAAQPARSPRPNSAEALISGAQAPRISAPARAETPFADATQAAAAQADGPASAPGQDGESVELASASPQDGTDTLALADTGPAPRSGALEGVRQEASTATGDRMISLNSGGDDLLVLHLNGTSWVEVDNGDNVRLYNDNLEAGDELTIRGEAPFTVLLGNATIVEMQFNSRAVDLTPVIRGDRTARVVLEP